jgi:microcystin-dependent protein
MSDQYLGEIRMVGFNFAPQGWALCNGQTLSISANNALFALLGTMYGGNGTTNFNLPDLQGRVPLHAGAGAGLPVYVQGQKAGLESITLTQAQLPTHTHTATFTPSGGGGTPAVTVNIQGSSAQGGTTAPAGNYIAGVVKGVATGIGNGDTYVANPATTTLGNLAGVTASIAGVGSGGGTIAIIPFGQSQSFSIEPPYLAVYFIIALTGIFPSRG